MNEWEKRRYAKTVAEVVVGGFANLTLRLFNQAKQPLIIIIFL
jgi:hypothetical protein